MFSKLKSLLLPCLTGLLLGGCQPQTREAARIASPADTIRVLYPANETLIPALLPLLAQEVRQSGYRLEMKPVLAQHPEWYVADGEPTPEGEIIEYDLGIGTTPADIEKFNRHHSHGQQSALAVSGGAYGAYAGLFARHYRRLDDIPAGSRVVYPDSPEHLHRTLLAAERAQLIRLKDTPASQSGHYTPDDIVENRRHLSFQAGDTATAFKQGEVVFGWRHSVAGWGADPDASLLAAEDPKHGYVVIYTRQAWLDNGKTAAFRRAFHSDAVRRAMAGQPDYYLVD